MIFSSNKSSIVTNTRFSWIFSSSRACSGYGALRKNRSNTHRIPVNRTHGSLIFEFLSPSSIGCAICIHQSKFFSLSCSPLQYQIHVHQNPLLLLPRHEPVRLGKKEFTLPYYYSSTRTIFVQNDYVLLTKEFLIQRHHLNQALRCFCTFIPSLSPSSFDGLFNRFCGQYAKHHRNL